MALFGGAGAPGRTTTAVNLLTVLGVARHTVLVDLDTTGAGVAAHLRAVHPAWNILDVALARPRTPEAWDISTFIDYTEGFVMPSTQGKVSGTRLQFQVNWASTWDAWCGLQTPVADFTGRFSCLDSGSIDDAGCHSSTGELVDCGRFMLCAGGAFCDCTAQGCQAWHQNCDTLDFDMQIAADAATGSVALGCAGVHNVHFAKDH